MNGKKPNAHHDDHELQKLDELLKTWHQDVDDRALKARQRILAAANAEAETSESSSVLRRIFMNRYLPYAAIITLAAIAALYAIPQITPRAMAQDGLVMLPDGGRLDAFDRNGNEIGPCSLKNTDVQAKVSGHFIRVDVEQLFNNTYEVPIEAVYTFPLSHRGAVDRMTMTIRTGNEIRFIEGEIEERGRAREIYEQARDAGYVASLLEQERPNIFTQSVANIEPGAEISISISYVETLESTDGTYKMAFPTVVGPRYIPGYPSNDVPLPMGCAVREGIVLRGPAAITLLDEGAVGGQYYQFDALEEEAPVKEMIKASTPIDPPAWISQDERPELVRTFEVAYSNGSKEPGILFEDNTGFVGGRWFCGQLPEPGEPFSPDTDQVPDASKITPMPVKPGTRAGHDISITVEIETGGLPIKHVVAPLHEIKEVSPRAGKGSKGRKVFELVKKNVIPNRDFILEWTLGDDRIQESILTHAKNAGTAYVLDGPKEGITIVDGHLALILNPPARVDDVDVPARELVFVLDTSGSMSGFPIEKAKAVMTRAIDSMRPEDTFNLITFAGNTSILWEQPRPATAENRKLANAFINSRKGGGGTEMMKAINAALTQTPSKERILRAAELVNLPADGREVRVVLPFGSYAERHLEVKPDVRFGIETSIAIPARPESMDGGIIHGALLIEIDGVWATREGRRVLVVENAKFVDEDAPKTDPMRIVVFMTDGYVGNDQAILAAIRENAATTRVFSFGIGNSINRFLLDGMAEVGRGAVEYLTLEDTNAEEAVERFARRIQTPVLIDLSMEIDGIVLQDVLPSGRYLPDLYDDEPIVIFASYQVPGEGTITLRGRTGSGPWSRTINVTLPAEENDNDVIATLWAREKIDEVLAPHLEALQMGQVDDAVKDEVITLGKQYGIMTPFTSFVAVEKTRVISDGKPMLVRVPIELPSGTDWNGFFGNPNADPIDIMLEATALGLNQDQDLMVSSDEAIEVKDEEIKLTRGMAQSTVLSGNSVTRNSPVPPPIRLGHIKRAGSPGAAAGMRTQMGGLSENSFGNVVGSGGGRSGDVGGITDTLDSSDNLWFQQEGGSNEENSVPTDQEEILDEDQVEHLARVLDRPLFRIAVRALLMEHDPEFSLVLVEEQRYIDAEGKVLVAIKLDMVDAARIDALKAMGLHLIATNDATRVVVGMATDRALIDIGLLDGVLRVIPTDLEDAPVK
jgi:hypothetical protein